MTIRFCGTFSKFKTEFYCVSFFLVSSRPNCIFEIHQLWQSGFSRVYSNCCCSCSFEPELIKIGQSSHKMYSNNILKSLRQYKCLYKKSGNLLNAQRILADCHYNLHVPQNVSGPHGWGSRIHRLYLCREVRLSQTSVLDMTRNYLGMQTAPSLPSLPGQFWPWVVASDRVPSMGRIEMFEIQTVYLCWNELFEIELLHHLTVFKQMSDV